MLRLQSMPYTKNRHCTPCSLLNVFGASAPKQQYETIYGDKSNSISLLTNFCCSGFHILYSHICSPAVSVDYVLQSTESGLEREKLMMNFSSYSHCGKYYPINDICTLSFDTI